MLETIRPNKRPQLRRPGPTPRRPTNQKPSGKLGEKGNERVKEGEGTERLAPPRVRRTPPRPTPPRPTPLRPTLAKSEKPRKKPRRGPQRENVGTVLSREMFPRSNAITVTRRAIMPNTALSQKTSGSFNDLQGPCGCVPYIWYPVCSKMTRQRP